MANPQPQAISLKVFRQFKASHSLTGFEQPHFHLWKIAVTFKAQYPLQGDRLIDLVFLQTELDKITAPLESSHLNDTLKASPTSENMAAFLWKMIGQTMPGQPLHAVSVTICNLEGEPTGKATLT